MPPPIPITDLIEVDRETAPGQVRRRDNQRDGVFLYLRNRFQNAVILAFGDAIALFLGLSVAGLVRYWMFGDTFIPSWIWYILPGWWVGASIMHLLPSWGLGPVEELRRMSMLLLTVYAVVAVGLFLSKQSILTSRLTLTIALLASLVTVPFVRMQIKRWLIHAGWWGIPVAIYGAGDTGERILKQLQEERGLGFNPVGVFDDDTSYWGGDVEGVPVVGGTDQVMQNTPVAILAMPDTGRDRLTELFNGPLSNYRTVLIIPNLFEVQSLWVRPRDLGGVLGLELTCNLDNPILRSLKRTIDISFVLITAPVWLVICLITGLLVFLQDRKNPFFLHSRIGRDGETFKAWKFRTMVPNAEAVLRMHLEQDEALKREWDTYHKLRVDPRVTRLGWWLRRFSIDEIPQLINVLWGTMSLVGPRPLPQYHHQKLSIQARELRERTSPGITGLWQVSGRSDTGTEELERWDAYYVRNWSLWLDVVILIRTFRAVIKGTGAY